MGAEFMVRAMAVTAPITLLLLLLMAAWLGRPTVCIAAIGQLLRWLPAPPPPPPPSLPHAAEEQNEDDDDEEEEAEASPYRPPPPSATPRGARSMEGE